MLKVTAFCHTSVVDDLVERLRRAGVLDIVEAGYDLPAPRSESLEARLRTLDEQIAKAAFVAEFLGRYHSNEAPFASFISEKIHLGAEEFFALAPGEDFEDFYQECVTLSDRLAGIERHRERLGRLIDELRPWAPLRTQLDQLQETEHVGLFAGTVPASEADAIRQQLREAVTEVTVEQLVPVANRQAWVVMSYREHLDDVRALLHLTNFTEVAFPDLHDYPAEEIGIAEDELAALAGEEARLLERAHSLSDERYAGAVALAEALVSARDSVVVRERFGATERTEVVTGWVAEKRRAELESALDPLHGSVDLTLEPPQAGDQPPIELENPAWLRPFEVLTDLYGRPRYDEVDPTPLMALFFWVFFGMALGDVGYGLVLAVVAWLIKTRLDVARGVKKFMDLLIYGGVSSMLMGVLTGSWFAIPIEDLPEALSSLVVLDPMQDVQSALLVSVAIGVVHVVFGIGVGAWQRAKEGDWDAAVAENVSTLWLLAVAAAAVLSGHVMQVLVPGLVVTLVLKGRAYSAPLRAEGAAAWDRALGFGWLALLLAWGLSIGLGGPTAPIGWGLLGLTVTGLAALRAVRKTVLATLLGAYETYSLTGLISDFLSYTRLAALGLASVLVGQVVNLLAGMVWDMKIAVVPIGVLLGVVILIVMHGINVAINLLGAFVHPTRLQFVEFFSKFYEGGGRTYAPFGPRTKTLVLHPGQRGQEGGKAS